MLNSNNEANVNLALQALQSNQNLSLRRATTIYCVPLKTLHRRQQDIQSRRGTRANSRKISDLEEQTIVEYILDLDMRGLSPRLCSVEEMVNRLLADRDAPSVGQHWASNFVRRQPQLTICFFRRYDYQRAKCEGPVAINAWLELIENPVAKYGIRSNDWYNFDETGFMMGVIMSGMVVTGAERRANPKKVQPGNREWVTAIQSD